MKLFITGATGFIGKHLVVKYLTEGHDLTINLYQKEQSPFDPQVKTWQLNENNPQVDIDFFLQQNFDGIIHLASLYLKDHNIHQAVKLIDSNVRFGTHLLECAAQSDVKWFINTGTFWQHYNDSDYSPVNLYSASKQAFEAIAQYYIDTNKIMFQTLKLSDTYGPNDTRPKIFNLWKNIAHSGEELNMSRGEQLIDITHVDDIVAAFYQLSDQIQSNRLNYPNGTSFAVKAEKKYSLKELADIFERVSGTKLHVNWILDYRPREVMIPWTKGVPVPGWSPKISLEEGIQAFINETIRSV